MTATSEELGEDAAREGEEGDATMPAQDDAFETVIREKVAEALATAGAHREAATQQAGDLRTLLTEAALRVEARFTQAERASGDRRPRTLQMAHRKDGDREVYILALDRPGAGAGPAGAHRCPPPPAGVALVRPRPGAGARARGPGDGLRDLRPQDRTSSR